MTRVGFLIDRWQPSRGGAERALAALAGHLEGVGCEVRAYGRVAETGAPGRFSAVRATGLTRARRERALARALVGAARADGCAVTIGIRHLDEVDLYWPHAGAHRRGLAARRRARGRAGELELYGRHRAFVEFERALLERGGARRVACVSTLVREELAELYPAARERLELIPNGVDLAHFQPRRNAVAGARLRSELGLAEGQALIAFAARDPLLKGLAVLFEALAGLQAAPWHLVVAGARHPRRWRGLAARRGLAGRVSFLSEAEPAALFAAADLLAHPTWRDASSLVVLEALASGTPVITTRADGSADAVGEGAGAVLEQPGDVAGLRALLADWLARIAGGAPDPDRIRAGVADRDRGAWLAQLEQMVRELAAASS